jgi:hypothetical protein
MGENPFRMGGNPFTKGRNPQHKKKGLLPIMGRNPFGMGRNPFTRTKKCNNIYLHCSTTPDILGLIYEGCCTQDFVTS